MTVDNLSCVEAKYNEYAADERAFLEKNAAWFGKYL